jgi:sugar phosphate isomerase/epimerase
MAVSLSYMRPRILLSYAAFYGRTFEEMLAVASDQGFSGVQFIPDQTPNLPEELGDARIETLRTQATNHEMQISMHNVFYDINLTSLYPAVADQSMRITLDVLEIARKLRSESLIVHPGYMFPGWRSSDLQRRRFFDHAKESMVWLADASVAAGVPILLENGSYYLTTRLREAGTPLHLGIEPTELMQLVEFASGRLGICLDVNKALHATTSSTDFVRMLAPHIRQLQMSTVAQRWNLVEPLLSELLDSGFDGSIVLEGSMLETRNAHAVLREYLAVR